MEDLPIKHKVLKAVISQSREFDSELSDFEEIGTPFPRGAHLSDNEINAAAICNGILKNEKQISKVQTTMEGKEARKEEEVLSRHLATFYECRVRPGLTRKESCEDIAYAVTYKVLRKVQTVDDRFRGSNLVPHGIPYDGLKANEPIFFEMILNLSLGAKDTLYVKHDCETPFARIQPMSNVLWKDCLTKAGFISASKVQTLLRKYVKQAVHVLRKYVSQGRKEKYPQNLKSLFIEGATGVTLIINRDIRVRVLPAFCIPDSRSDFTRRDCPSSSHVVCCPKTSIPHDILSLVMESPSDFIDDTKGIDIAWRVSFYVAEKNKMRALGDGCRIQLLRILTEMRDNEEALKSLSSYHLKTLLFHECAEQPDVDEWSQGNIGIRFMDLLTRLKQCLIAKSIPHYFMRRPEFPSVNLLEGHPEETLNGMVEFVEAILKNPCEYLDLERCKNRNEFYPWEPEFDPVMT